MKDKAKKNYFHAYFEKNAENIKDTWVGIKSIICLKNNKKSQPNSLLVNNKLLSNPKTVADTFNDHFSSVATKLQNKIHHYGKNFSSFLKDANPHSFFITPTDPIEVSNKINELHPKKAQGPSSIPTAIFRLIIPTIAQPLTEIINLSFSTGTYIDSMKVSKVIPIFKEKGSDLDFNNYRLISLLSNVNKIIEKIMHERLYNFLEKYNIIYILQYGFRKGHSTNHCLFDLTESIRKAIDGNKFAVGVFVDLQKAFDTVNHTILIEKLKHYGIRGIANEWFKSYLTNRHQFVSINGTDSEIRHMEFGVPQGSVLGPLLFLIYINDLHNCIRYSTARHFADDTNLLLVNSSLKQLKKQINLDLCFLSSWLKANKISLNVDKTEILVFHHVNKDINYDIRIKLDGKRLYPSNYVKYLGLLIDPHLTWSFHTKSLASKLTRAIGMLAKVRHFVNKSTLHNIYNGIFSSLLNYGCQIWGQHINSYVKRIIKLQEKAIRVINFADFRAPTSKLYKSSNILKFTDNIILNNYLYVHDSFNRRIPTPLQGRMVYLHATHSSYTRISKMQCVKLPIARTTEYGLNSIISQAARNWNVIQITCNNDPFHLMTRNQCKQKLKAYLIEKY